MIHSKKISIGLDISDRNVRFVELECRKKIISLRHRDEIHLGDGIIVDGIIQKPTALQLAIKDLFKGERLFKEREVVYDLPEQQSFLKTIIVTPNQNHFESLVQKEASNHFPYPLTDLLWDYQIIEKIPHGLTHSYRILIAAIPRAIALPYEHAILSCRLTPAAAEIESLAIARALLPWDKPIPPTLIIDIGSVSTCFIVVDQHALQFTTTISTFGGSLISKAIAEGLHIQPAAAEKMKQSLTEDRVSKIGKKILMSFLDEIHRVIDYYEHHCEPDCSIISILCTGSGSQWKGLVEEIEKNVKKTTRLGSPDLHFSSSKPNEGRSLHSYTTAVGLCLRNFQTIRP